MTIYRASNYIFPCSHIYKLLKSSTQSLHHHTTYTYNSISLSTHHLPPHLLTPLLLPIHPPLPLPLQPPPHKPKHILQRLIKPNSPPHLLVHPMPQPLAPPPVQAVMIPIHAGLKRRHNGSILRGRPAEHRQLRASIGEGGVAGGVAGGAEPPVGDGKS